MASQSRGTLSIRIDLAARMTLGRRIFSAGGLLLVGTGARAQANPVQVYAAMTFHAALDAVLDAHRDGRVSAVGVYGPTPVLVRQLEAGAPADILLTADPAWMDDAGRRGLIRSDTRANLLANELVLAGPAGAATAGELTPNFPLLERLDGGRLAMCDPDRDPAGRYAKQSLQALGLWDAVQPFIAVAESSLAAVALVDRGEVSAAICFQTDLHGDNRARQIGQFGAATHAPIVYPAALTSAAKTGAQETLAYLRSAAALRVFKSFGYRAP